VPNVLKKRDPIKAAVTKRYHKQNLAFGIEFPRKWADCVRLEKENNNTIWKYPVKKEIENVRIAFKILNGYDAIPPIYQDDI
jgi:hypothetical protein